MGLCRNGSKTLVKVCADVQSYDTALVISDSTTVDVGLAIVEVVKEVTKNVSHITIEPFKMHGQEPPPPVAEKMKENSVVFGITKMSMAHTEARQEATLRGVRYLSLPDYSMELLCSAALQVDFKELTPLVERVTGILSAGKEVKIMTSRGTELFIKIDGRQANSCPGWCYGPGTLASPPDVESNVAPLESESNGVVVVDGSIPNEQLGLIDSPLILKIENGQIVDIKGRSASVLEKILDSLNDPKTRILAELGFGLNPKARICGVMLEDEGCLGTVHLGFGSNSTIGGNNCIPFHLDMVLRAPTVLVDNRVILKEGKLTIL